MDNLHNMVMDQRTVLDNCDDSHTRKNLGNNDINSVANFVERIRIKQHPEENENRRIIHQVEVDNANKLEEAQKKAQRTILKVEKFRAAIEQPGRSYHVMNNLQNVLVDQNPPILEQIIETGKTGMMGSNVQNMQFNDRNMMVTPFNNQDKAQSPINLLNIGSGVSNDDFFHLTCHIEPNLIHKIEKGEFVELEKLLPKDRLGGSGRSEDN